MEHGEYVRSTKAFYDGLKRLGYEKVRDKHGKHIDGLQCIQEEVGLL